jgi:hypothetical protein
MGIFYERRFDESPIKICALDLDTKNALTFEVTLDPKHSLKFLYPQFNDSVFPSQAQRAGISLSGYDPELPLQRDFNYEVSTQTVGEIHDLILTYSLARARVESDPEFGVEGKFKDYKAGLLRNLELGMTQNLAETIMGIDWSTRIPNEQEQVLLRTIGTAIHPVWTELQQRVRSEEDGLSFIRHLLQTEDSRLFYNGITLPDQIQRDALQSDFEKYYRKGNQTGNRELARLASIHLSNYRRMKILRQLR